MSNPALERFLARLMMRSDLTVEEQRAILGVPYRLSTSQGRVDVVSPGETVQSACLVSTGLAARFDQMRDGKRQIAAFYVPGDMCDLHSVVAPTAGWGIAALSPGSMLHIPHSALRELVIAYPGIAMAFWRDTVVDGSILAKWVGNLGRLDARARLAHMLCEMGLRLEQAALATRTCFTLDLTQEQLADALGLTPVHVNRTMQRLRSESVIATQQRSIEVHDWNMLVDIAEFDPAYLLLENPVPNRLQPARGTQADASRIGA